MNEFHHFLRTRRSIRYFKPDPVPALVVDRILTTATFAPSAHNLQPWRFVLIQTDSAKEKLGMALTEKMRTDMDAKSVLQADIDKRVSISLRRIDEAPVVILLCRDKTILSGDAPEEEFMAVQSTALAGLQLLLAAQAEGLGSNWICWPLYTQKETIGALELPKTWLPEAMFFLGFTDEDLKEKTLRKLNEITKFL